MAVPAQKNKVSPETWIKLGVFVAGGVAVAFGVKKVLDFFKPERKREEKEEKTVIDELEAAKKKKPLTYPKSQYANFANIIDISGFDLGTDEAAIYSVFRKLKNDADYLALAAAWGSPKRTIYYFGLPYKLTLPQFIRWEMSNSEAGKINKILSSKNIRYRV
jgi:hypothetical protein